MTTQRRQPDLVPVAARVIDVRIEDGHPGEPVRLVIQGILVNAVGEIVRQVEHAVDLVRGRDSTPAELLTALGHEPAENAVVGPEHVTNAAQMELEARNGLPVSELPGPQVAPLAPLEPAITQEPEQQFPTPSTPEQQLPRQEQTPTQTDTTATQLDQQTTQTETAPAQEPAITEDTDLTTAGSGGLNAGRPAPGYEEEPAPQTVETTQTPTGPRTTAGAETPATQTVAPDSVANPNPGTEDEETALQQALREAQQRQAQEEAASREPATEEPAQPEGGATEETPGEPPPAL